MNQAADSICECRADAESLCYACEDALNAVYEDECRARHAVEMAEARKLHPHACGECWGSGFALWGGPDGHDTCEDCVGQGRCPRCGESSIEVPDDASERCTSCGWSADHDYHAVLPHCPF